MAIVSANGAATPLSPNVIINGAFDFWQRGTSFTNPTSFGYTVDRWRPGYDGTGATRVLSQQNHPLGISSTIGQERAYFHRYAQTVAGSGGTYNIFQQTIEDVRTFAGQTITVSFYAKAATAFTIPGLTFVQGFGTGGSTQVENNIATNIALTSNWQRFIYTYSVPSISGKTIGPNSVTAINFNLPLNSVFTFDLDGVQVEAGSIATPFRRNANSLQGELAACQRYYQTSYPIGVALQGLTNLTDGATWVCINTSDTANGGALPVTMRATPAFAIYSSNGGVAANSARDGGGSNITGINLIGGTSNSIPRINKNGGLPATGNPLTAHWTANAEL
jgi:hypothetical protein